MDCFTGEYASETIRKAADLLGAALVRSEHQPVLCLVSGGSALEVLDVVRVPEDCRHLTLAVVDERFSSDPSVNNFAQLAATEFFASVIRKGGQSIDTRPNQGETVAGLAQRFQSSLTAWKHQFPEGMVVALLGIGADGHTAGILPVPDHEQDWFASCFNDSDQWVVGYDAGRKNPYPVRVTTTLSFLRERVDQSIAFAIGESKRDAIRRVFADTGELYTTPARILREMRQVTLVVESIF